MSIDELIEYLRQLNVPVIYYREDTQVTIEVPLDRVFDGLAEGERRRTLKEVEQMLNDSMLDDTTYDFRDEYGAGLMDGMQVGINIIKRIRRSDEQSRGTSLPS